MRGRQELVIDASDFIRGMSSSAEIADGGFSPDTDNVNLTKTPGVLYAPALPADADTDTRLAGNLIASSPDMNVTSPTNRLLVDDTGKGYRYNGTKISAAGVALTAAQTYAKGFTDIIVFAGEAYISSKEKLTRWQNDDTIDAGASWPFSFANTTVPHPGLVYQNNMYWGDKNVLKYQTSVGDAVAPAAILTLSADQVIIALGVDPSSGKMLISTTTALDVGDTLPKINRLLWYDGLSAQPDKEAIVDAPILSFYSLGGIVYVGYSNNIGYLSGSGIRFLRKLLNVSQDVDQLPWKHNITSIGNTLCCLDGLQVLAFGDVLPGRPVFYYALKNLVNSNKPTMLANGGNFKLIYGFATTKFYHWDSSSVASTNTMAFVTNVYRFDRPISIDEIFIEWADAVANAATPVTVAYVNRSVIGSSGSFLATATITNGSGSAIRETYSSLTGMASNEGRTFRFRFSTDTNNYGIARVIFYYHVKE